MLQEEWGGTQKSILSTKSIFHGPTNLLEEKLNICLLDVNMQPNFLFMKKCKKLVFLSRVQFLVF